MIGLSELVIILVLSLPVVAVVCGLIWVGTKMWQGETRSKTFSAEETRVIQELQQGFSRMEDRMEALETILLEREQRNSRSRVD